MRSFLLPRFVFGVHCDDLHILLTRVCSAGSRCVRYHLLPRSRCHSGIHLDALLAALSHSTIQNLCLDRPGGTTSFRHCHRALLPIAMHTIEARLESVSPRPLYQHLRPARCRCRYQHLHGFCRVLSPSTRVVGTSSINLSEVRPMWRIRAGFWVTTSALSV